MDEDLGFKIQMSDMPLEPVKQQVQQAQPQPQPKGEGIPLTSSNYDLNKASHPKACIFTFLFKLITLITYMFLGDMGKVLVFIIVVLFSAFDFWTVKNITGRLLVGLKWENTFTEDGTQSWEFYSTENKEMNVVDSAFFWSAQISSSLIWGLFAFLNILNPFWVIIFIINSSFVLIQLPLHQVVLICMDFTNVEVNIKRNQIK